MGRKNQLEPPSSVPLDNAIDTAIAPETNSTDDEHQQIHLILNLAIEEFRQHTKSEKRLLLTAAVTLVASVIIILMFAIFRGFSTSVVLGSGTSVLGLLTFAVSQFDKLRACEHECSMLKVQFAAGGKRALCKALDNSTCTRLSKLRLK